MFRWILLYESDDDYDQRIGSYIKELNGTLNPTRWFQFDYLHYSRVYRKVDVYSVIVP